MEDIAVGILNLAKDALEYSVNICSNDNVDTSSTTADEIPFQSTLMLRNIPNKFTRDELLHVVSDRLEPGEFDFFYLPSDFRSGCNFGYAFINLTSEKSVDRFYSIFHKLPLCKRGAPKSCQVGFARIQSLNENIVRLMNSPIMGASDLFDPAAIEAAMPLLFDNQGNALPFPRLPANILNARACASLAAPPHRKPLHKAQ